LQYYEYWNSNETSFPITVNNGLLPLYYAREKAERDSG
jgi:hypothetical protein